MVVADPAVGVLVRPSTRDDGAGRRLLAEHLPAEDHVQEVFLRARRSRDSFESRASARTWLYRIATNACLDTLRRQRPRMVPDPSSGSTGPSVATMPWLLPYPDAMLEELVSDQPGPEALAMTRESLSLAYLTVIQTLPPRQRAVLILRDVLDWPAREVAALIDVSVPAVKSAATVREHQVDQELAVDADQRRLLRAFIAAHEDADPEALIALLRHDVRLAISPQVGEWNGHDEVPAALRGGMNSLGTWRVLPTSANGQPAAVGYLRRSGETAFLPFVISVLDIRQSRLIEIAAFEAPHLVAAFGLPDAR